jgi:signal transduction histidine kinase
VVTGDDLGQLSSSFNQMMDGLQEREQLRAENTELLEDLRASRARIVAASDAERRRVERNIHDGAQQRLVAVAVKLRVLEEQAAGDDCLRGELATAGEHLRTALEELRELARGLHPAILTTEGLLPAIEQLAEHTDLPITISGHEERYPEAIELAAYFVACEALANVAKYAQAKHVDVEIKRDNGRLVLRIVDDGVGGANPDSGSGLTGLEDRLAAIDGRLSVQSPPGAGTELTAELPLP